MPVCQESCQLYNHYIMLMVCCVSYYYLQEKGLRENMMRSEQARLELEKLTSTDHSGVVTGEHLNSLTHPQCALTIAADM